MIITLNQNKFEQRKFSKPPSKTLAIIDDFFKI